jgi:hypothetical protein
MSDGRPPWSGIGAPVGVMNLGGEAPCIGDILGLLIALCRGLLIGLCVAVAAHINKLVSTSKVQTRNRFATRISNQNSDSEILLNTWVQRSKVPMNRKVDDMPF